ncbi:unnamed protein product, partial [Discosporangium mesarthrocarpum]
SGEPASVVSRSRGAGGVEKDICRLYEGQCFGEKALLYKHEEKYTISVVASSAVVEVACIPPSAFDLWENYRLYLLMKEVPLLAMLPLPALDTLQQSLNHQSFPHGQYIVRQGEQGAIFFMITKGTVEVLESSLGETGLMEERLLVQMFEGHYFGELALIYGEPRNASVRAKGEVHCMCLTKEAFRSCMNDEKFQQVLEQVAFQRADYRRQRALQASSWAERRLHAWNSQGASEGKYHWQWGGGEGGAGRESKFANPNPKENNNGNNSGSSSSIVNNNNSSSSSSSSSSNNNNNNNSNSTSPPRRSSFRETVKVVKRKMENGSKIINKYQIIMEVGRGTFGTVHLCRDEDTGKEYAMKVVDKKKRWSKEFIAESLRREVAVMKKLRHPNIVTLWEVIDDPKSQQLYMIQDYVEMGPLLPEGCNVPPLSTRAAREKMLDCLRGLHYLHSHSVVHGDIKPANLLVSSTGTIKIGDFGAAII